MFRFEQINQKKILVSDLLPKDKVKHFFTTRESVVTPKEISGLVELSKQNLFDIAKYLDLEPQNIISPVQTHSDHIKIAKAGEEYHDTDALIVDNPNIAILLNFADCTPVILYDNKQNIGAIAHAGWRGTASRIVPKTLLYMKENYSTDYKDITAIIGPAISIENYQVDKEVFEQLKSSMEKEYTDFFGYDNVSDKYNTDLKTINKHQLEELGTTRIDLCEYCTYASVDVFFSYRKEQGKTARHSAILKLIN